MLDYNSINKLFGKPLSQMPIPRKPYVFKWWHLGAALAVIILTSYGANAMYKDLGLFVKKHQKKEE